MRRDLDETLGSFLSRRNKQGARKDDAVNMKDTGKMVSTSWHEYEKAIFMEMWERESNCSRVGTVGTESAVRKRGGNRNLPYLNAANSVTGHVCMNSNKLRPMTKKRSAVCILIILF